MNSGIYSLIARDRKTNKFVILPISEENNTLIKHKVNISSIDKLTTKFTDEKQLAKRLFDNKYIDFTDADIFIRYKYSNVFTYLEPIYKNLGAFSNLITNSESTIEHNNPIFLQGCDTFFTELNNPNLRKYINSSFKINKKLKEHIDNLYSETNLKNVNFRKSEIIKDLTNYRVFRNLTSVINEYKIVGLADKIAKKNEERKKCFIEEDINIEKQQVMDIEVPSNFSDIVSPKQKVLTKRNNILNDAEIFYKEEENIMEKIDLDDILSMSKEDLKAFGINKDDYDDYENKAK